jgi:hypothetical protein
LTKGRLQEDVADVISVEFVEVEIGKETVDCLGLDGRRFYKIIAESSL